MKIYLDTSVYNRPFDDQIQPRIWLETMAFFMILQLIETEEADLITSSVIAFENSNNPFAERKRWVTNCLKFSKKNLFLNDAIRKRASELERQGIKPIDALHVACAETGEAEYFLTCDDKIIKRYEEKEMMTLNPVEFIFKVTEE
mgnify:CR=1 FL=1